MKAPAPQIGPDPKIARRIYAALDEHFDEDRKLYRTGWADAKVAETLDVSIDLVTRIRREAYGELAEPPEIQGFRDDLELLRMQVVDDSMQAATRTADMLAKISELEGRIAANPALRKAVC
jgi:hypothetical protein